MQWQEIGEQVHLTGQGVKNRIVKMEKLGVITGYTINIDSAKIGKEKTAFITVFMKTNKHLLFIKFINNNSLIIEANRISGEGCYLLKILATDEKEIISFLDEILIYGNYRLNMSIDRIK